MAPFAGNCTSGEGVGRGGLSSAGYSQMRWFCSKLTSESGTVWLCSLVGTCDETTFGALAPPGFGLTALAAYGETGDFAMLARAYEPRSGTRVSVRLIGATGARDGRVLDEMAMAAPLTVDNFEGMAVVPRSAGGIRVYLLSDDNGSAAQHTYLLAFDWQPAS